MTDKLATILEHLQALVAFDTQNPPRNIQVKGGIIDYLQHQLPGFAFTIYDAGDGCIALLARRGETDRLFNFHIDTVPIAPGWQRNPHALSVEGDKAYGLGACDIKGASACMLAAARDTQGPVALLFSSDEEHGSSLAVKTFLAKNSAYREVLVSEPTQVKATLAHRGIQSGRVDFKGVSGHASEARAVRDNAIHKAAHWLSRSVDWIEGLDASFQELTGLPFNAGKIEGGIKNNMIAAEASITFGFRPLPGMDSKAMLNELEHLAHGIASIGAGNISLTPMFYGPTLPAANQDFDTAYGKAQQLARQCGLQQGPAVNFWTEASLFSEAGMTALVFGPGDIAQAHTPDEWVLLDDLERVYRHYVSIIDAPAVS